MNNFMDFTSTIVSSPTIKVSSTNYWWEIKEVIEEGIKPLMELVTTILLIFLPRTSA